MSEEEARAPGFHAGLVLDGRYRLVRPLGTGGMGAVWVGRQFALEREVAVKVLHVTDAASRTARARLRREAMALAAVRHPAVVQVHDCGETEDGVPYVVMELVSGEGLAEQMARRGALPAAEAVALVMPLLDGLGVAHDAGVVHRDIKPANVVLSTGPAGVTPKLLDFGIALVARAARDSENEAQLTADGDLLGTPAYMAPEQVRGLATDERTDVWGMGALLYALIAGEAPFGDGGTFAVLRRVVEQPPSYPRRAQGLDGHLWSILMAALRKDPAQRIPSARALRDALAGWLAGEASARAAPTPAASPPTVSPSKPPPPAWVDTPPSLDGLIRTNLDP